MSQNAAAGLDGPGPEARHRQRLAEGVFEIQRCTGCGKHQFYPRVACRYCGSADLRWVTPSGSACVYSTTVVRRKAAEGTREQFAAVAVSARKWAALNPDAFMRQPLTIADVLSSRMVSDPVSVRDCCLVTDGGGAVIMVRADRARDFPNKPAYFLGGGMANWHMQVDQMESITQTAARQSGADAFAMAGLRPSDVDVAQLYDAFTINTVLALEDLGFCAKGEGGAFAASGAIAPGGSLPVNTNGGGLSCCHPGMYGIFTLVEATAQLRGTAGERQVDGAEIALCHGNGGRLASQATAMFGSSV